jgi:hypothetical protein
MQSVVFGALVAPTAGAQELTSGRPLVLADPRNVEGLWSAMGDDVTHLVLLGERRHESLVRRQAALIADRGIAVAWRVVPHGPAAVVALLLEVAAQGLDAGLMPAYLDELAARTWSGAWMPSVAKLEEPTPSLVQHIRSLLPAGGGFLVTLSGRPGVVAVGSSADPAATTYVCASLLCADGAIPELAVRGALELCGAEKSVTVAALTFDPLGRFGSAQAVEMLALPTGEGIRLPRMARLPRCVACGAAVANRFCAYCHVRPAWASVELQGAQK